MNNFRFEYLDNKSGDVNKGYTYKWMRSTSDLLGFLTAAMVRDSVMTMPALQVTKDFIFNELNDTCGRKISSDFKNGGLTLDNIFVHSMLIDDIEMDKPDEYPYVILSFIDEDGEKVVVNDIINIEKIANDRTMKSKLVYPDLSDMILREYPAKLDFRRGVAPNRLGVSIIYKVGNRPFNDELLTRVKDAESLYTLVYYALEKNDHTLLSCKELKRAKKWLESNSDSTSRYANSLRRINDDYALLRFLQSMDSSTFERLEWIPCEITNNGIRMFILHYINYFMPDYGNAWKFNLEHYSPEGYLHKFTIDNVTLDWSYPLYSDFIGVFIVILYLNDKKILKGSRFTLNEVEGLLQEIDESYNTIFTEKFESKSLDIKDASIFYKYYVCDKEKVVPPYKPGVYAKCMVEPSNDTNKCETKLKLVVFDTEI